MGSGGGQELGTSFPHQHRCGGPTSGDGRKELHNDLCGFRFACTRLSRRDDGLVAVVDGAPVVGRFTHAGEGGVGGGVDVWCEWFQCFGLETAAALSVL